jgi:hypothetical protein
MPRSVPGVSFCCLSQWLSPSLSVKAQSISASRMQLHRGLLESHVVLLLWLYLQVDLPNGGKIKAAAIVGHDGGVWAQSADFPAITPEQVWQQLQLVDCLASALGTATVVLQLVCTSKGTSFGVAHTPFYIDSVFACVHTRSTGLWHDTHAAAWGLQVHSCPTCTCLLSQGVVRKDTCSRCFCLWCRLRLS